MIACVFIADFAVVVAREYHGISPDWPLLVVKYNKQKAKVFAASPEARMRGVKPGMASHKALALYPQALVVSFVESPQRRAADDLLEALCAFSDRLELECDSMGTIWIDFGNIPDAEALDRAKQIRTIVIDRSPFLPTIGIANGKFASRIAAITADDDDIQLVPAGNEKRLLAPLSIERLALKKKQLERFKLLGINTLGQLVALPAHVAQEQFGEVGKRLHQLASGMDLQPIAPYTPRLSQYRERQFEPAIDDRMILRNVMQEMTSDLAASLAAGELATQDLVLTLCLDDKQVIEERFVAREPLASQISLFTNFMRLLDGIPVSSAITSLEVGLEDLARPLPRQLDFFGQLFADPRNVLEITDTLSHRYGIAPFQQIQINAHHGPVPERWFRFKGVA